MVVVHLLQLLHLTQPPHGGPDGRGSCGGIVPGTSGHGDPAVFCAALPDADNLPLHVLLAAESADVLGVLRDLHLLNSLTEGGAVPGHIIQTK